MSRRQAPSIKAAVPVHTPLSPSQLLEQSVKQMAGPQDEQMEDTHINH